ncbi:hypothetical protein QAD02_016575 [Eretmocerus hayati]|uniref:Uncharacterized protein n=1 Tax=Eretmocerus hayati TaxID=131215 RepID=A0ACC2PCI9_9HYME|nr:hypothetical protein QAD02_016575 [Eretmocerus hayati]
MDPRCSVWGHEHVPQRIGKCNDIEKFDRVFFGIHSKLCNALDPMARILLECAFEAVMDAGINPRTLRGANVSVFNASNLSESEKVIFSRKSQKDGFLIVGGSKAMIPNRVSFFLGLTGSSVNVDNDMTGGATALECAYNAIKDGHCDAALVTGCMVSLHPHISFQLKKLGLLSEDGYTRCFDDSADGHTRGDGVAALYLQRADDAKRIYQEVLNIKGKHCNTVDINEVLYFPKVEDQIEMMKNVLNESGLSPDDIIYLEGSGMGIKEADAQELEAIDAVYGRRKKPLPIGSIKSVIGNAPAVAVLNSILKMVIGSETGLIPANLNYEKPNSKAAGLKSGRLFVPTDLTPWTGEYTNVNSSSILGAFASLILKSPKKEKVNDGIPEDDIPRIIFASGRTEEAVSTFLSYVESRPVDSELVALLHEIFQSDIDGHLYRGYSIVPAKGILNSRSKKREILFNSGESKEIWWVYSGMGSQWAGMGEALLQLPVFEAAIRKCDAVLKPRGYDIFKVITDKDPKMFDLIINSFIGIAAIQIGLTDVLKSLGLEPDYIIGHSVGELGCAYADGCFTAEQMILAALSRGLASVETKLDRGSMAAVGLGYEDVHPLCPPDIDVACHNGPESSTISGPAESMKAFVASLSARGIFAREVNCSNIAYHSRYIAPAGPNLMRRLQEVIPDPKPRSSKWVSSSVPRREWNTMKARLSSAEYHTNNLLSAVLFDETARQIPANAVCIEIAPHGLLQAIVKRSLPKTVINIALTRRDHPNNLEVLLAGIGQMYNIGMQPQISNIYPKVQFPVGKGTPSISSLVKWDHSADWGVRYFEPPEEKKEGEKTFQIDLNDKDHQYLKDFIVDGLITIPISVYLFHAWEILKSLDSDTSEDVIFEDIRVNKQQIVVPGDQNVTFTVAICRGSGSFEIMESEESVLCGTIRNDKPVEQERLDIKPSKSSLDKKSELNTSDFYKELGMRGLQYSNDSQNIVRASIDGTRAVARWKKDWISFIDCLIQSYILGNDLRQAELPLSIRKIVIDLKRHESSVKNNEVEIFIHRELNYLTSGGVEIQGIKCSPLAKIFHQDIICTDGLSVVPNINKTDLPRIVALRMVLQLVIESIFSSRLQTIKLIEVEDSENSKAFQKLLRHIPESALFKTELITPTAKRFDGSLNVVLSGLEHNVAEISKNLSDGKFLLSLIAPTQLTSYLQICKESGLKVVSVQKSEDKNIVLVRKVQPLRIVSSIHQYKDSQDILSQIKKIKITSDNERIILIAGSDNITNTIEAAQNLKKVPEAKNLRVFIGLESKISDKILKSPDLIEQFSLDLFINIATSQGDWSTLRARKINLEPAICSNWTADSKYSYDPTDIIWTEGPIIEKSDKVVKVEYAALNRQDILIAKSSFHADPADLSGKNRILPARLGLEFSGVDSRGKKVMGITRGSSLSNNVQIDPDWTWPVPDSWTLEDAATVPFSYILAYSALVVKAEVQPGEKVLLTNTCDGLGLAIFQLAIKKKCEVFVTYETVADKKLIKTINPEIQEKNLLKYTKGNFRDVIRTKTGGQGVDVIICNQDEVKSLERLFEVTKHNARVVLINDLTDSRVHEYVGLEIFLREISLFSVVPAKILASDERTKKALAKLVSDGIKTGFVKPLPRTTHRRESLQEVFRDSLQNGFHNKIIIRVQPETSKTNGALAIPRLYCSGKKSYVILEGLTDFGLELVDWLITRGAKHIVIGSKSDNNSSYKNLRILLWQSYGVQVVVREGIDISQKSNLNSVFKEAVSIGPIDAIFDLSGINISKESKKDPKGFITKIADELSRSCPELRQFVVCSSTNNSNHYCGCSQEDMVFERIIQQRKNDGLEGIYIRWGMIESRNEGGHRRSKPLPPVSKYLQKFDEILGTKETTVNVSCIVPESDEVEKDFSGADADDSENARGEIESFNEIIKDSACDAADLFSQIDF